MATNIVDNMRDAQILKVLEVHHKLLDWCEAFDGGFNPIPKVTISGYYIDLSIGEIGVWDSESGYHDEIDRGELTVRHAISCFQNQIYSMLRWPRGSDYINLKLED